MRPPPRAPSRHHHHAETQPRRDRDVGGAPGHLTPGRDPDTRRARPAPCSVNGPFPVADWSFGSLSVAVPPRRPEMFLVTLKVGRESADCGEEGRQSQDGGGAPAWGHS